MENSEPKIGVIYMYTSPSGKKYIGQTINEKSRKYSHKSTTIKKDTAFGRALRKYGFENFTYERLIKFSPTSDILKLKRVLNLLEVRYIKMHNSFNPETGYNCSAGGDGCLGYKHTPEMIEYIRECSTKMMNDPERKKHLSDLFTGRTVPEEQIERQKNSEEIKKRKKAVYQYDLKGNLVNSFDSIGDAARSFETEGDFKTRTKRISDVCGGRKKSYNNFIWTF